MNLSAIRLVAASTVLLVSTFSAPAALARTIRVPADYPTIQAAINAARVADRVLVAPGHYVETIHFLGKRIMVVSEAGPEHTVINANAQDSVVTFANGEGPTSVLKGFRLAGGSGKLVTLKRHGPTIVGGGVFCWDSSPTIQNCHFMHNLGVLGPGRSIFCGGTSAPRILGCLFTGTRYVQSHGLLVDRSCPVFLNNEFTGGLQQFELHGLAGIHLEGNSFSGNEYLCVDALCCGGGEIVIKRNRFAENYGGLVHANRAAALRFEANEVARNVFSHGGIDTEDVDSVEILDNVFSGNIGADVRLWRGDRVTLSGNTVVDNEWNRGSHYHGIEIDFYDRISIQDNVVENNRGSSVIRAAGRLDAQISVIGNVVASNEYDWISVSGDSEFTGNEVSHNRIGMQTFGPAEFRGNEISHNEVGVITCTGPVRLIDNSISGNRSAGLYVDGGEVLAIANRIAGNSGSWGGSGVRVEEGTVTLKSNWITDNSADSAIYMDEGSLTLENNWITNNSSKGSGAGVYIRRGTASIRGNWFTGNASGGSGGAICIGDGAIALDSNLIAHNSAVREGGGVHVFQGENTFRNNTIVHNQSGSAGGGVYSKVDAELTGCILWQNEAASGADFSQIGGNPTVSYSLVQGGWPGTGNIDADPLFVAPGSDYRLSADSPCIEGGEPYAGPDFPRGLDLGGTLRFLDGDLDGVIRVDMGAYEFSHVRLDVTGDLLPGGLVQLEITGTAGLMALLWIGEEGPGELLGSFGELFVDLSGPWFVFDLGALPFFAVLPVPGGLAGIEVQTQALALGTLPGTGNLSNPVLLRFE